ncbi:MAG: MarR family transcriptional regulator [Anaerolineales bacterium]
MEEEMGYLLKKVQHALHLRLDKELAEYSLTMAQFGALRTLEEKPNASNADLARGSFVTPQTMIKILQGLEQAGYVKRQPHPYNKRVITTQLTPAGVKKLAAGDEVVRRIEAQMLMHLTLDDQRAFRLMLSSCCDALKQQ